MVTDNFAKKHPDGIFTHSYDNIETALWPLPISNMFMVAAHFYAYGLYTIGNPARLELPELMTTCDCAWGVKVTLKQLITGRQRAVSILVQ